MKRSRTLRPPTRQCTRPRCASPPAHGLPCATPPCPHPEPASLVPCVASQVFGWQKKLAAATEEGKARKMAYYRRLLTMYPPMPSGHKILASYVDALIAEYQKGDSGMVALWIEATDDSEFEAAGTTKEFFDEWQNTSELLVKEKLITIGELKNAWGVTKRNRKLADPPPEEFETPYAPPPATTPPPQPMAPNPFQRPMMMPQQQMMMNPHMMMGQQQMMQQTMHQSFGMTQTTVQQTIIQQPPSYGVQKMAATVPFGVYGGMQMTVQTHQGPMRVTVPPGYGPGSTFYFNMPVRQVM